MSLCIGIDTSSYTTSVACVDNGSVLFEKRTVLSVPMGQRGLRQSEALFQHNKNLPALLEALFDQVQGQEMQAVGVSVSPTDRPGSYMPVFLAGKLAAVAVAGALRVPLTETSHQIGHIRAALYGNEQLFKLERFLAVHLSGGTTDVLMVEPWRNRQLSLRPLGASCDLHAGQFVDRVAVRLGTPFPGGKHLEELALLATNRDMRIPSSVNGANISFSGAESAAMRLTDSAEPAEIAWAVYDCLARTLCKWLLYLSQQTGCNEVLLSGGVASSALLRTLLLERVQSRLSLTFGQSVYSSDNALGVALTAFDRLEGGDAI